MSTSRRDQRLELNATLLSLSGHAECAGCGYESEAKPHPEKCPRCGSYSWEIIAAHKSPESPEEISEALIQNEASADPPISVEDI